MPKSKPSQHRPHSNAKGAEKVPPPVPEIGRLRIIAGSLRSRTIPFHTDPRTRPMKDRTREAMFNLLGGKLTDMIGFDLFAGSGILAMESVSRGAKYAVAIELFAKAARDITTHSKQLGIDSQIAVFNQDTFRWAEHLNDHIHQLDRRFNVESPLPWCVFICPPYKLWETQTEDMRQLLNVWTTKAPAKSLFAIELDESTPIDILPSSIQWQTRLYRPAMMAIGEIE